MYTFNTVFQLRIPTLSEIRQFALEHGVEVQKIKQNHFQFFSTNIHKLEEAHDQLQDLSSPIKQD